ncbi:vitrin isoform X1 [Sinocyclocheilus grahami]|uniref:vitrin isoform X1 n=1 Tax=Sinocyclocheilus grahami TaxID=75366 RepID=UPI0007AD57FC|nr:PREDICTED: vitrin-like isoform X1 [Sinocyclocheilus grahami]XP_016106704.1 PREDICTED: vitrin-like isoform X1 [Sinocyclocheilus grahami]
MELKMSKATLTAVFIAFLLTSSGAKPNGKNKKPKQAVPSIECDMRAGKINLSEFIVKCPANCRETKEKVYGTGVFASISSICNAAIHSGVITNSGGKVIVMKMAGQAFYKGSFANGVRSLSLPNWRESFSVSVGKPKKGVTYPSTLVFVPSRPTTVKTGNLKDLPYSTASPVTEALETEPSSTTALPTTTHVTTPITTSAKPRVTVHKVREAGSSHPYFSSVARQSQSTQGKGPAQAFRGSSVYANRFSPRTNTGVHRPETGSMIRRQPHVSSASAAFSRVQPQSERKQHMAQSNPALARRDWPHPPYTRPDGFSGTRRPTDSSHSVPNTGYKWSRMSTGDPAALDPRPDNTEYEHWLYNFGQYSPAPEEHKPPSETSQTRGVHARGQDLTAGVPEPMSQGDPNCKVDIAFLMDGSWSIGKRRFKIQKDFLVEVSQVINVGVAGAMMGIIQYGDDPVTEFSLKQFSSSKDLKPAISKIVQKGGLSNVGKALSYINKHFFSDANGNRGGAPNVAVVLVDGWPTDKVEEASRLARESGINIFFVTIEGPDENEKQNVVETNFVDKAVCRSNGYFSLSITSWFALRKTVQPLVKSVCDTDRLVCSKTCLNANDIAFVIDGSSSVGTGNFRTVLQFVANVTQEFEISDTDTRVGIVQYTYEQRLEFAFGQHDNKADLLNAIKRINYWSGGTSTGAAITFAADQLFSKSKPNKRKIMIVITDGRSYDDVRTPALAVHRKGVIAYSIGIAWAAQDELEYIATDPDRDHSFFVDEFDNLYKYVPKIIHNICNEFNSQPRN